MPGSWRALRRQEKRTLRNESVCLTWRPPPVIVQTPAERVVYARLGVVQRARRPCQSVPSDWREMAALYTRGGMLSTEQANAVGSANAIPVRLESRHHRTVQR